MATSKKPVPLMVRVKETTPPSTRTGGRLPSEITALTSVSDDHIFTVEDPSDNMCYRGTFAQFKAAVLSKTYGIMQTVDGDTSSPLMALTGINATPAMMFTWNLAGLASGGMVVNPTTGVMTVPNSGIYEIDISLSFSGQLSKTFLFEIFQQDVSASPMPVATGFKMSRKMGTGGDVGSATLSGLINLAAGDGVMIHVSSTDGGTNILVHQAQMKVAQV